MKARRDHLKALVKEATEEKMIQQTKVEGLKKLLEETQGALKSMNEHISLLTDEAVVPSITHFK